MRTNLRRTSSGLIFFSRQIAGQLRSVCLQLLEVGGERAQTVCAIGHKLIHISNQRRSCLLYTSRCV